MHEVRLLKEPGKGLGIRIADQPYDGGSRVVVEDVMVGGAAHIDGKLKKGWQFWMYCDKGPDQSVCI